METGNLGKEIEQETITLKRNWLEIQNPGSITLQDKYQNFVTKKQRTTSCMQWIPRKFCFSSTHDQMTVGFDTLGLGGQRTKIELEICSGVGAQCRKINGKPYGYKWKGEGKMNQKNCAIEMVDANDQEKDLIKLYGGKRIPDTSGNNMQNDETNDWSKWEKCNCWLCGLPLYFADADAAKGIFGNTKMKPECEHKLPILFLIMYGAGPATKIFKKDDRAVYASEMSGYSGFESGWTSANMTDVEDKKVHREHTVPLVKGHDFIEWKRTVRGWSYAWSHRVCNKIKSAMCFLALKVDKIDGKDKLQYTILDDMLEKFADIITRKKPLKTLLRGADDLYRSNPKNPLGKPFGIWTNKQGDWRTIHRRSFYNFDNTKPDYEEKYDGLQVWQHEKHPLHAELKNRALTIPQKKAIIKGWLNDKRKNKNNWKNMVMYNLRQSLVPLVVELNKGKKGSDIHSQDSQMAILKNILANKFRFQHYIRKIFGGRSKIGDGTTKTDDWDKVKNSYKEINQYVASGEINYEVLKNYFNNIFIQDEGFIETDMAATRGGCWPNCGRKKRREDGTDEERQGFLSSKDDDSDLSDIAVKEDDDEDSDLENMFDNLDDIEGEDGMDVNDNMDEYIDVNIVNMSNVMSTFIDDENKQGKLDWNALDGEKAWKKAEITEMQKRRTVKIPRKPIADKNAAKKKIEDLEVFIGEINKNEDEFFNGDMTLSYDADSDDNDGPDISFNLAEYFTETESELDTSSEKKEKVLAIFSAKQMANLNYEIDFHEDGTLKRDNIPEIKIKQKKLNYVRQVLKWKLKKEVTPFETGFIGDNEEGELKNEAFKMIFEGGRVESNAKQGEKSTLLEDYQDYRFETGLLHEDFPDDEYINELQGNLPRLDLEVKKKILKSTIFWKNLVNIIDNDNFEYFEDMIDNYFEDETYLKFLDVNKIEKDKYKNTLKMLLERSYPENRILLQAKKLNHVKPLWEYIEKKVPQLNLLVRNIISKNIILKKTKSVVESIIKLLEIYLNQISSIRSFRRSVRIWHAELGATSGDLDIFSREYKAIKKKNTKKKNDMKYYEKKAQDEATKFNKLEKYIFNHDLKNLNKLFASKKITKKQGGTKKKKKRKKTRRKKTRRKRRRKKKKRTRRKK